LPVVLELPNKEGEPESVDPPAGLPNSDGVVLAVEATVGVTAETAGDPNIPGAFSVANGEVFGGADPKRPPPLDEVVTVELKKLGAAGVEVFLAVSLEVFVTVAVDEAWKSLPPVAPVEVVPKSAPLEVLPKSPNSEVPLLLPNNDVVGA
jgi:hypothetical protein